MLQQVHATRAQPTKPKRLKMLNSEANRMPKPVTPNRNANVTSRMYLPKSNALRITLSVLVVFVVDSMMI